MNFHFNYTSCRFEPDDICATVNNWEKIKYPLSIILQVTRKCNFSCVFCSETEQMPDPSIFDLKRIRDNSYGVSRIYVSGGEPTLRKDLIDILDLFYEDFIVGLPTNATALSKINSQLKEKIHFANIGLDGPRNVTSRIRGDYDLIMSGILKSKEVGIPFSLSCVILASEVDALPFVCQIGDVVKARKIKIILPIPKGNALNLPRDEYLSNIEAKRLFDEIVKQKKKYGWTPIITLTTWTPEVEGYSIGRRYSHLPG